MTALRTDSAPIFLTAVRSADKILTVVRWQTAYNKCLALVAQWIERLVAVQKARGSSPFGRITTKGGSAGNRLLLS